MADFLKNDYISCDITKQSKVKQSAMTKVSRVSESTKTNIQTKNKNACFVSFETEWAFFIKKQNQPLLQFNL